MSVCIIGELDAAGLPSSVGATRARMIGDAMMLRALALRAMRDGLPKAELRAANARRAARRLLQHVRRMADVCDVAPGSVLVADPTLGVG